MNIIIDSHRNLQTPPELNEQPILTFVYINRSRNNQRYKNKIDEDAQH